MLLMILNNFVIENLLITKMYIFDTIIHNQIKKLDL